MQGLGVVRRSLVWAFISLRMFLLFSLILMNISVKTSSFLFSFSLCCVSLLHFSFLWSMCVPALPNNHKLQTVIASALCKVWTQREKTRSIKNGLRRSKKRVKLHIQYDCVQFLFHLGQLCGVWWHEPKGSWVVQMLLSFLRVHLTLARWTTLKTLILNHHRLIYLGDETDRDIECCFRQTWKLLSSLVSPTNCSDSRSCWIIYWPSMVELFITTRVMLQWLSENVTIIPDWDEIQKKSSCQK